MTSVSFDILCSYQQAHMTLKRITQLLNMNCMKMMMGMEFPMLRNAMMSQLQITYDTYIGEEIVLPKGNDMVSGNVKSRVKDFQGQPTGKADKNPILDTRVYNVEFSDGENAELGADIIAECMYAECDIEGNQYRLMDHIVDHGKDNNVFAKRTIMLQ